MPSPASFADYQAAVVRFTTAIDRVLAGGAADCRRHDEWMRRHGEVLAPHVSAAAFAALPPAQRHVITRTIALSHEVYRSCLNLSPAGEPAAAPAAPRVMPHRDRI